MQTQKAHCDLPICYTDNYLRNHEFIAESKFVPANIKATVKLPSLQ